MCLSGPHLDNQHATARVNDPRMDGGSTDGGTVGVRAAAHHPAGGGFSGRAAKGESLSVLSTQVQIQGAGAPVDVVDCRCRTQCGACQGECRQDRDPADYD